MVATAKTKMSVRPARRMLSAISFGVFCRSAPSTNAIIRSRKVEPCAAVMRTLIQSERTRVPPVTAERSPPLSRITGADSPVIADSSIEATPSITSPSLGMRSRNISPCMPGTFFDRRKRTFGTKPMKTRTNARRGVISLFDPAIIVPAIGDSFRKLHPRILIRNPVMFVVEIVSVLTTILFLRDLLTGGENLKFTFQIIVWLWITLLFANFAEAVAEGRGKAQAAFLRKARTDTRAKRLIDPNGRSGMTEVV